MIRICVKIIRGKTEMKFMIDEKSIVIEKTERFLIDTFEIAWNQKVIRVTNVWHIERVTKLCIEI